MKVKKQKKGISLIVLVITIIIMIILASAIIISLSNNGIISKANEAVDKTNEKQVQELASLAWADAYAENVGKSNEKLLQALKTSVEKVLTDNNLNKEDYGIYVTTTGVTIVKGWLQTKDRTVVKGSTTLYIGDYVDYKSGVETYKDEEGNENGWQVLGAENGELLILSSTDVANKYFNEEKTLEGGKDAYENGISELNEICAPYGKGAYATGARSITVEDVDRVTGYDKTTYNKGLLNEYGNIVTYSYNGTNKPAYSGTNRVSGTLTQYEHDGFHWYDENGVYHSVSVEDLTSNSTGIITDKNGVQAIIRNTYYGYNTTETKDLKEKVPNAYNMLFGSSDEKVYVCASTFVATFSNYLGYGFNGVVNGGTGYLITFTSMGEGTYKRYSVTVRAVVQLSADTILTGSSEAGWNIQ